MNKRGILINIIILNKRGISSCLPLIFWAKSNGDFGYFCFSGKNLQPNAMGKSDFYARKSEKNSRPEKF